MPEGNLAADCRALNMLATPVYSVSQRDVMVWYADAITCVLYNQWHPRSGFPELSQHAHKYFIVPYKSLQVQLLEPQHNFQDKPRHSSSLAHNRDICQEAYSRQFSTGEFGLCQYSLDFVFGLCAAAVAWQAPAIILHTLAPCSTKIRWNSAERALKILHGFCLSQIST